MSSLPPRNLRQDLWGELLVFDHHSKCEDCECDSAYVVTVVTVVWTNPVTKRCIFFGRKEKSCGEKEGEKLTTAPNNYFHMTSRRPYWCPKTILWELNSFLMQTLSFVPINLHRCWSREWKHSIPQIYLWIPDKYSSTSFKQRLPAEFSKASPVWLNRVNVHKINIFSGWIQTLPVFDARS